MLAVASKPTQFRHAESMIFQSSFHLSQIFPEDLAHILPTSHNDTHYAASPDREDYFAYEEDIFDSGSQISSKQRSLAAKLNVDMMPSAFGFVRPNVCGHRGAVFAEPENTVNGFRAAANMGCDSFELDVFLLKDGKLVVFHGDGSDKTPGLLHSYCGMQGSILDYNYDEVQRLKLRKECEEFPCPDDKFYDAYIPLLEEVLMDAKKSGIYVRIELKGPGTEVPSLELVEKLGMVNQCSFASFNHERVAHIRKLRPERKPDGSHQYITGCLYNNDIPDNYVEECAAIGATEVHLKYDTCTQERIAAIHDKGLRSMAWFRGPVGMKEDSSTKYLDVGNEDETMYLAVVNTGVMIMCVNKPDVLLNLLGKMQSLHAQ